MLALLIYRTKGVLTVGAVQVGNAEDVSGTALGSAAEAGAEEVGLTFLNNVGGVGHGGAGKSEDGEELHVAGFGVLDGIPEVGCLVEWVVGLLEFFEVRGGSE